LRERNHPSIGDTHAQTAKRAFGSSPMPASCGALTTAATSQTVESEAALHPRIAKAIEGLEDAMRYMEAEAENTNAEMISCRHAELACRFADLETSPRPPLLRWATKI
jgi:hypothetical protein